MVECSTSTTMLIIVDKLSKTDDYLRQFDFILYQDFPLQFLNLFYAFAAVNIHKSTILGI